MNLREFIVMTLAEINAAVREALRRSGFLPTRRKVARIPRALKNYGAVLAKR
jgi:hypothetical protein